MPPPIAAHFIDHDPANKRVETTELFYQRIAAATTDVKKTVARVVHEAVH